MSSSHGGDMHCTDDDLCSDCVRIKLAKIRARRDEIRDDETASHVEMSEQFWRLFDDGAEFGPDLPEPEYSHVILVGASGESVNILKNGEKIGSVNAETFKYLKSLGAKEASKE